VWFDQGMSTKAPRPHKLSDFPIWRVVVALDDAERFNGPGSATTRTLARELRRRLRRRRPRREGGVQ